MLYKNFILISLVIVCSAFTKKSHQVDGYLNDVSPNEEWILYRVPEYWGPDELHVGTLSALHIPTGKILKIASIFIEQPSTFFLDDKTVAIPVEGHVELYDLESKQFKKEVLVSYNKEDYQPLQFSLNEDRTKAAILLRSFRSSVEDILKDKSYAKVELRVLDLQSKQEYTVEHYTYDSESSMHTIGEILWHEDQVIYSFQSKLYYYQLGNPRRIFFTDRLGAYAIDGDALVYGSADKDKYYQYKTFSFADRSIKAVEFESDSLFVWEPYYLQFYTTYIDGEKRAILSEYLGAPYYAKGEHGKFAKQDNVILYKSKRLSIPQLIQRIKLKEGGYDDKVSLIINKLS